MSIEKYRLGLPIALILALSSIGCDRGSSSRSFTDCGSSGTNSASTILREGETIELEGVPVAAKSGQVQIPIETIGVENIRLVARHKHRIYWKGREADISIQGEKILIETDNNKKITVSGEPDPQVGPLHTKLSVEVECKR